MAIISFITTQLVQAYPHYTNTHTLPQHPLYNWSTAPSLHPVFLHFFFFFAEREVSLMRCSVTKGQRYTPIQQERARKTKREEERVGFVGAEGEREVDPDSVYPFFLHWFETDLHCAALQATGSEISPSARSPDDLIQTGYPSVTVTGLPLQQQDVLIIYSAEASQEPKQELRNKNCMFLKCIK